MKKKLLCLYAVVLLILPTLSAAEADTLVCYDVSDFSPYTIRSYTLSYGQLWLRDAYLSNIDYFGRNLSLEVTNLFIIKPSLYLRKAFNMGPTAAMALPPQIAVPALMRAEVLRFICRIFRPMNHPNRRVPNTEIIVNIIPSRPDANDSPKFIPKPSPTTEYCNSTFEPNLFARRCVEPKIRA